MPDEIIVRIEGDPATDDRLAELFGSDEYRAWVEQCRADADSAAERYTAEHAQRHGNSGEQEG